MTKEKFHLELVALRTQKGYTQTELADAIGVSERSINLWERGKVTPRTGIRIALAQFLLGEEHREALLFEDELHPASRSQAPKEPQSNDGDQNILQLLQQLQDTLSTSPVSDDVKKSVQSVLNSIPQIIEK